jgi:protein-tyrosine phosphatase
VPVLATDLLEPSLRLGGAKMIDLHCHILPGVDDGPAEISDSVGMARQAAEDGIEAVCATPHIRHDHDVRIGEIGPRIAELQAELERAQIPVSVISGGEVAETAVEGLDATELRRVTLGDGAWVLLEPGFGPLSDSLRGRVRHLAERGYRALIAHPERHLSADLAERLAELVGEGALVQVTADFLLQAEIAPGILVLAERGLVHVLGSDAHSSLAGRPLRISAALEVLRGVELLRPHLDWIAEEAPAAIVRGEELEAPFEPR